MTHDDDLLLALLNTAPMVDGIPAEQLDERSGAAFSARFGGSGTPSELRNLRRMRDALQGAICGDGAARDDLAGLLAAARFVPEVDGDRIRLALDAPNDQLLAVRAAMAWSHLGERMPGRLRPCANEECNLFLLDRSRPGTARWCSMATCGNRMKARAHAGRRRAERPAEAGR